MNSITYPLNPVVPYFLYEELPEPIFQDLKKLEKASHTNIEHIVDVNKMVDNTLQADSEQT